MDICPKEHHLVYSTLSPYVQLVDLNNLKSKSEKLTLKGSDIRNDLSIISLKFSGDAHEIVAANNQGSLIIYDLIANRISMEVKNAH